MAEMIVFTLCHVVGRRQSGTANVFDIVESSCTPRSCMLAEVLTLHPQMSMGRGGGCGTRLFGTENSIASVFVASKSR